MKYSVIIPVYNASATLRRCLESLVPQLRNDIEVLLINDGSLDDSGEICREYERKYRQMRCFDKENGGVSSARNLGLDHASGEYVLFVDSDDVVSAGCFEQFDRLTERAPTDFYQFSVSVVCHGEIDERRAAPRERISGAEMTQVLTEGFYNRSLFAPVAKLFKRSILEAGSLRFENGLRIGEDLVFVYMYALIAESMAVSSEIVYSVMLENTESLSRKRRDYLCEELLRGSVEMKRALERAAIPKEKRDAMEEVLSWVFYRNAYSCAKELMKYPLTSKERRKRIRNICEEFRTQRVRPKGWKCRILAAPVQLRMSFLIEALARHSARRKEETS